MLYRSLSLLLLITGLALLVAGCHPPGHQQVLAGDDKVHEGKVVKAGDGKLTMTFKGDEKKHTHDVAKDAKITLDGKPAKLDDLKEGYQVKVTMDAKHVVTKIEAHSKKGKGFQDVRRA